MRAIARLPLIMKLILVILFSVIAILVITAFVFGRYPGPAQPIPFSHQVHVTSKQISCFFCHPDASRSSRAGFPSVEKCMLCHKVIASNFEPVKKVRVYYDRNEPIPWIKVNRLPDFTHFSHQCHIAAGKDCGECHGNVKQMDRITSVHEFNMGFCVDCHSKNRVSIMCYSCHY